MSDTKEEKDKQNDTSVSMDNFVLEESEGQENSCVGSEVQGGFKSDNVLDMNFSTKLGDFGIAKLVDTRLRTHRAGVWDIWVSGPGMAL